MSKNIRSRKPDKNIHMLLVDDEHNIVMINQMVLEQMGYIVHSAYDSREAIDLIKEYNDVIDIIVTDYLMPGMNGIELAMEARKYLGDTPVILYTGKAECITEKEIDEADIARVVIKPGKMKDLNTIIRNLLNVDE